MLEHCRLQVHQQNVLQTIITGKLNELQVYSTYIQVKDIGLEGVLWKSESPTVGLYLAGTKKSEIPNFGKPFSLSEMSQKVRKSLIIRGNNNNIGHFQHGGGTEGWKIQRVKKSIFYHFL